MSGTGTLLEDGNPSGPGFRCFHTLSSRLDTSLKMLERSH